MDAVITYVNGSREQWVNSYKLHVKKPIEESRYRDNGLLGELINGIRSNMKYINNIFLVVSNIDQVPTYINRDEVKIITHDKFIPKNFLPCFNSCTIEMFLGFIPGLCNEFVYFNDDMIPIAQSIAEDFFINGKPCLKPTIHDYNYLSSYGVYRQNCINSSELLLQKFKIKKISNKQYLVQQHCARPMTVSSYNAVWKKCKPSIIASLTRVRSDRNYNAYLFNNYDWLIGNYVDKAQDSKYFKLDTANLGVICNHISERKSKFVCLNDGGDIDKNIIINAFNEQIINTSQTSIIKTNDNNINYKRDIIVSFTSWKMRINDCINTVKLMLNQTIIPSKIILNLSEEEFPNKENELPSELIYLLHSNESFQIYWVKENFKQFKKIVHTLNKYKSAIIISIDDDFNYPTDFIETLVHDYYDNDCNNPISYSVFKDKTGNYTHHGTFTITEYKFYKGILNYLIDNFVKQEFYNIKCFDDPIYTIAAKLNGYVYKRGSMDYNKIRLQYHDKTKFAISKRDNNYRSDQKIFAEKIKYFISTHKTEIDEIVNCDNKIIVNLTTWKKRESCVPTMLEYFKNQTLKPYRIFLWLSEEEYDINNLPNCISKCINLYDIKIKMVKKNTYCHKRQDVFKYYSDAYNIFIDDDIYYPFDFVESLYCFAKKYKCPVSYFCRTMIYSGTTWNTKKFINGPLLDNRYYGGLSCVPPYTFPMESFNYESERNLICPKCDESWLQMWFIKNDIPVYGIHEWKLGPSPFKVINDTQDVAMWNENKIVNNGVLKKVSNISKCIAFLNIEDKVHKLWPNLDIVKSCEGMYDDIKKMSLT